MIINELIKLMEDINIKEITENEIRKKVVNNVEKILNFDEQWKGERTKKVTPKQMLQGLPIEFAQVKIGIHLKTYQMKYILCIKKKKLLMYNNIMNSMTLWNKIDTIFMNSKNNETSNLRKLLLNLTGKINLKRSDKYVALSNLSIYYTWKNIKKACKNNKFKVSALTWNEEFELPDGSYSVTDIRD